MISSILFNSDMSIQDTVLVCFVSVIVFVFSLCVHEFAHAFVATKMGDETPRVMGRLTLNPLKHLDPMGFLSFLILGVGWAKPVQVNPLQFKKYKTGMRLVSIAGICANFLLGIVCAIIYAIVYASVGVTEVSFYVLFILNYFMVINSCLFLFNLIPIFPLDGFNFFSTFVKADNKFFQFLMKHGANILLGLILIDVLIEAICGISILSWYMTLLYRFVFSPIAMLGV